MTPEIIFRHRLAGAKEQLAVVAAIVGRGLGPDRVEALLDGSRGFVRRQNAAPGRNHGQGDLVELSEVHCSLRRSVKLVWGFCRLFTSLAKG